MIRVRAKLGSGLPRDKLRRDVLSAMDRALAVAQPENIIPKHLKIEGERLLADGLGFSLKRHGRILVIGGGKAAGYMGEEVERILGNWITGGLVAIPDYLSPRPVGRRIKYHPATHPTPSMKGIEGVTSMLRLVGTPTTADLIIVLLSGGGSALMPWPTLNINLQDERHLTSLLLTSGANIEEINTVRKHLSMISGGQLAKLLFPARVLTLIISDVVGDKLDAIASGPTAPDPTTYRDSQMVLQKFHLWSRVPDRVRAVIRQGLHGKRADTPKEGDRVFRSVHNLIIGNNRESCIAAAASLRKAGYASQVLSTQIKGESREVGRISASILTDIRDNGLPLPPPAALVAGGETTVTVKGRGRGGRNQELALAGALRISGSRRLVIGSVATDGVDGPTDAAGAMADGTTVDRGRRLGLDPEKHLDSNDSYHYFSQLKDLIMIGPTGTNVNDIVILAAGDSR